MISVERVSDPTEILAFPHRIYQDDPAWVPPLDVWVRKRLAPTHPFFKDAELQLLVARRDGEVVGTISVLRDRRHEAVKGEKVAFFGFFEAVDDPAVARVLFDAAADVARGWGAAVLRGPRNLSRVEETGLCVEGHAFAPPMLAGHHPAYYQALVEGEGFVEHHDVLAYHAELYLPDGTPRAFPDGLSRKADAVNIPDLDVHACSFLHLTRDLSLAYDVFVEAFRDVPENTPMPREQFLSLGRVFLAISSQKMLQLATAGGKPAGFALCFPEMNEAVRAARGHLFPFGWASMLAAYRGIRTASFKLIGVLPEHRRSGLHALMARKAFEGVRAAGYRRLEASLIDSRNKQSRGVVEGAGMEVYKRYRIYERGV